MSWYYRTEAKGIQGWIMSTSRLRELRGGSAAIENILDTEARKQVEVHRGQLIQAAAGALSCTFDSRDDLAAFARSWPWFVAHALPGLQVVQAWAKTSGPGRISNEARAQVRQALGEKRNLPSAPLPWAGPLVARNARSGLPAIGRGRSTPEGSLLTDATARCKEAWQRENLHSWSAIDGRPLALDDAREGLIAVIHADGTGVGQRLMKVPEDQLQTFSDALRDASHAALEAALRAVAARSASGPVEAQVVVAGGDDLTVLCAAEHALTLVGTWLAELEARTTTLPGAPSEGFTGLRAGAGVAISSVRYPFIKAYELAEHLARHAKRAARDAHGSAADSVIAIRRITTSFEDPDLCQGVWRLGRHLGLERSPLPTFDDLTTLRSCTRGLGRGGLRTWLGAFEAAVSDASGADRVTPNRLWERMREVADGPSFGALEAALARAHGVTRADDASPLLGAFAHDAGHPWTPIKDALLLNTIDRRAGNA